MGLVKGPGCQIDKQGHRTGGPEDDFTVLSLPIPKKMGADPVPLSACLDAYLRAEPMTGVLCAVCCQPFDGTRCESLVELPPTLIFHLGRNSADPVNGRMEKITTPVEIPEVLDLREGDTNKKYGLRGVVHHHGTTAKSGHYTISALEGNQWFHVSDSQVKKVPAPLKDDKNQQVYMLFYELLNRPVPQSAK
jgi:ubiquitin C-terminal hydrolase